MVMEASVHDTDKNNDCTITDIEASLYWQPFCADEHGLSYFAIACIAKLGWGGWDGVGGVAGKMPAHIFDFDRECML